MTFEDYLVSKKIDLNAFQEAESALYKNWKLEFEQMHPDSFTSQKLYLINPIRRKYTLIQSEKPKSQSKEETIKTDQVVAGPLAAANPEMPETKPLVKPARPVFKPKPKIN